MTKLELADMLERFIGDAHDCGEWEWDDFTSVRANAELEPYRQRLIAEVDPSTGSGSETIRQIIFELRTDAQD